MHGRFRSRDKDGSHTIQSAIDENPMLHTNSMALCFTEPELWLIKVLYCGNTPFYLFCTVTMTLTWDIKPCSTQFNDLDQMTFIYELDPYSPEIYWMYKYELPMSRLSKVII